MKCRASAELNLRHQYMLIKGSSFDYVHTLVLTATLCTGIT